MNFSASPMVIAGLGPTEILLILLVLVLLFGAKKLPELARGSGRALRIFKAETKGLMDDDEDQDRAKAAGQQEIAAPRTQAGDAEVIDIENVTPDSAPREAQPRRETER